MSPFALYVDEKLNSLDKRSITLTERLISALLFDMKMGSAINTHDPLQAPQFQ